MKTTDVRLEDLIGREVHAANNRRVGRIEEVRAETTAGGCVVTAFVIGVSGLFERLGLGARLIVGARAGGHVARWDQMDLSDLEHPRLKCGLEELAAI